MIRETMAGDNRFEIIAKAKHAILESTNIETSEDEMKVLDNILFRCWQMGWLDKYDDTKNQMGWIPVSERLPKDNNCVLVTRDGDIEFGKYEDGEWFFWLDAYWMDTDFVVAWMPLPEPYRGEGKA